MRRAANVISRSGDVMPRASSCVRTSETMIASGSVRDGPSWCESPSHVTNDASVTVAATSTPSLILIERNRSSGRTSVSRRRTESPRTWRGTS